MCVCFLHLKDLSFLSASRSHFLTSLLAPQGLPVLLDCSNLDDRFPIMRGVWCVCMCVSVTRRHSVFHGIFGLLCEHKCLFMNCSCTYPPHAIPFLVQLEWAIFAVRNACMNCDANQAVLSSLQKNPTSVVNYDVCNEGKGRRKD